MHYTTWLDLDLAMSNDLICLYKFQVPFTFIVSTLIVINGSTDENIVDSLHKLVSTWLSGALQCPDGRMGVDVKINDLDFIYVGWQ